MIGRRPGVASRRGYPTIALRDHRLATCPYGPPMTSADIAAVLPGVRRMAQRTPLAQNGAMDSDDMERLGVLVGDLARAA
jgi:hypothetical protein